MKIFITETAHSDKFEKNIKSNIPFKSLKPGDKIYFNDYDWDKKEGKIAVGELTSEFETLNDNWGYYGIYYNELDSDGKLLTADIKINGEKDEIVLITSADYSVAELNCGTYGTVLAGTSEDAVKALNNRDIDNKIAQIEKQAKEKKELLLSKLYK